MKKKNLLTAVLLLMAGTAMAQNALQVEDFTLPQNGGDIAMTLTLDEADKYVSYQFKIQTPVGVGYVADSDDDDLLYKPFMKMDDLSEGLGLGLPLSKRHALSLGGDLIYDRDYKDGCRFIVEMPK